MDVAVIDVPNAWGMLLYRKWVATLGDFLSMDLTHVHIHMGDGTFEILYSQPVAKNHVINLNSPDYWSDFEYYVTPRVMDYDPSELPFVGEYCIDTLLPNTNEYKEKVTKYQGKD
jgi:hypothetical protein